MIGMRKWQGGARRNSNHTALRLSIQLCNLLVFNQAGVGWGVHYRYDAGGSLAMFAEIVWRLVF